MYGTSRAEFPRRIVCLTAETAEIAFLLGAGERVVGVPGTARRPEAAREKARVGGFTTFKLDKILATPEVQEVYDEAIEQQKEATAAAKKPIERKPGEGIDHEPVTQSPQGNAITIKAGIEPSLGAKKIMLSFSADGALLASADSARADQR